MNFTAKNAKNLLVSLSQLLTMTKKNSIAPSAKAKRLRSRSHLFRQLPLRKANFYPRDMMPVKKFSKAYLISLVILSCLFHRYHYGKVEAKNV